MFSFREIKRYLASALKNMTDDRPKPSTFHALDSHDMLKELLSRSEHEPVILFKHSLTCGISSMAHSRISRMDEENDPPVFILRIQSARSLSMHVAQHFDVRHESPQAIVIYKGASVFHTSHSSITPASLREATESALLL